MGLGGLRRLFFVVRDRQSSHSQHQNDGISSQRRVGLDLGGRRSSYVEALIGKLDGPVLGGGNFGENDVAIHIKASKEWLGKGIFIAKMMNMQL